MDKEQKPYDVTIGNKCVHTYPKGINPKVNVIAWLEFELAYYDAVVYHANHSASGTSPIYQWRNFIQTELSALPDVNIYVNEWK